MRIITVSCSLGNFLVGPAVKVPKHEMFDTDFLVLLRPSTKRPCIQNVLSTKRPSTKRPSLKTSSQNTPPTKRPWIQNVLVYKTSRPQNVLPSKRPHLQNVLAFTTSFHKTSFPLSFHKTSFFNLTGSLLTFTIKITAKTSKNCI